MHMFASGDSLLCPVVAGAKFVKRVRSIPGSNNETKRFNFLTEDGKVASIISAQVPPRLRVVVESIGKSKLGFSKDDIGMHLLRSGGAMVMFLSGVPTIVIIRIGRWSSEALEQVESFSFRTFPYSQCSTVRR